MGRASRTCSDERRGKPFCCRLKRAGAEVEIQSSRDHGIRSLGPMENQGTIVVIWDNFADYHYDRLSSAKRLGCQAGYRVVAIELVRTSKSHQWADVGTACEDVMRVSSSEPKSILEWARFVLSLGRLLYALDPVAAFLPSYSPLRPLLALLIASILGIRTIMMNESHAGTAGTGWLKSVTKTALLRLFTGAFVAGNPQLRYFAGLGIMRSRIAKGYSAVDGGAIAARSRDVAFLSRCNQRYRAPHNAYLSLGRLVAKKNIRCLIEAYAQLIGGTDKDYPALTIVGSGDERSDLIQLAQNKGLETIASTGDLDLTEKRRCVCFYPFCRNADTAYFYANALAFILPSVKEEWGLVVNEAIACGIPVIVSDAVGCVEDLVRQNINGFCFPANDATSLAQCMQKVWDDRRTAAKMRARAREMAPAVEIDNFGNGFLLAVRTNCDIGSII